MQKLTLHYRDGSNCKCRWDISISDDIFNALPEPDDEGRINITDLGLSIYDIPLICKHGFISDCDHPYVMIEAIENEDESDDIGECDVDANGCLIDNEGDAETDKETGMRHRKCIVAAINANGEPDLFFVIIQGTKEQFENGDHYEVAMNAAKKEDYEPKLAYDELDSVGGAMLPLFVWETASITTI